MYAHQLRPQGSSHLYLVQQAHSIPLCTRVVTIAGGKLAAVGGCDDVFGRAESETQERVGKGRARESFRLNTFGKSHSLE